MVWVRNSLFVEVESGLFSLIKMSCINLVYVCSDHNSVDVNIERFLCP